MERAVENLEAEGGPLGDGSSKELASVHTAAGRGLAGGSTDAGTEEPLVWPADLEVAEVRA